MELVSKKTISRIKELFELLDTAKAFSFSFSNTGQHFLKWSQLMYSAQC